MNTNPRLKFNDPAPNIELLDTDGQPVQLGSLWAKQPLLLSFTRHFGCPQCKEMLDELSQARERIQQQGLALAVIMHAGPAAAKAFAVGHAPSIRCLADPNRIAYAAYGLGRGTYRQTILSPSVWKSNQRLLRSKGYKVELPPAGQDALQMSGVFIIGEDGRIRLPYYYDHIADHPTIDLLLRGVMGMDWRKPFDAPIQGN
jgi:peroxiredoxin